MIDPFTAVLIAVFLLCFVGILAGVGTLVWEFVEKVREGRSDG